MSLTEFTQQQLSLRNGDARQEIWVAVDGLIYDVTDSRMWRNGKHYDHWAGQDLTKELEEAPHLPEVIKKFRVVGKLKK